MCSVGFLYQMVDGYCSVTTLLSKVVAKGLPYLYTVERRGTEGFRTKLFIAQTSRLRPYRLSNFPQSC